MDSDKIDHKEFAKKLISAANAIAHNSRYGPANTFVTSSENVKLFNKQMAAYEKAQIKKERKNKLDKLDLEE